MTNYTNTCICMHNHNDDTIKMSDTVLRKIYPLTLFERVVWEGVGDRTELQHIDPHSYGHQCFFPVLLGCSTGGLGAQPLWVLVFSTASYLQLVWSPTDWISCALSYIIVQRPPSSCGRHNFALIQPVHGQGYNLDISRPDAPVIYTGAFPILTAQPGRRSIYNTTSLNSVFFLLDWLPNQD